MYKLHDFLEMYLDPKKGQGCSMELENKKWVNARFIEDPPPFWGRMKDAWLVIRNKAEAVEKK